MPQDCLMLPPQAAVAHALHRMSSSRSTTNFSPLGVSMLSPAYLKYRMRSPGATWGQEGNRNRGLLDVHFSVCGVPAVLAAAWFHASQQPSWFRGWVRCTPPARCPFSVGLRWLERLGAYGLGQAPAGCPQGSWDDYQYKGARYSWARGRGRGASPRRGQACPCY